MRSPSGLELSGRRAADVPEEVPSVVDATVSSAGIVPHQVRQVARLARLELDEHEVELFTRQLGAILEAFQRLQEVDTQGVDPTFYPLPLQNVLREDEVRPSLPVEAVLRNAPEREGDFFKVPRVIEGS